MTLPNGVPDCPRGLEYLATLNQLLLQQKSHLAEAILGFEENNKYIIKNCLGQNVSCFFFKYFFSDACKKIQHFSLILSLLPKNQVYLAAEDTNCCTRNCCGNYRPFNMKVLDLYSNEIIHFYRPLRCSGCCFPCCMQSIEVSSQSQVIGRVEEEWTCWFPNFKIKNEHGETVLRIEGPCCTFSCCSDINFKVMHFFINNVLAI